MEADSYLKDLVKLSYTIYNLPSQYVLSQTTKVLLNECWFLGGRVL